MVLRAMSRRIPRKFETSSQACSHRSWERIKTMNPSRSSASGRTPTKQGLTPNQRIADAANFVRGQHNERPAPGLDCADLGDGNLPVAQDFEEFRLEFLAHFVDFVDQQDTRFVAQ